MKKQYKPSITKNHNIKKIYIFLVVFHQKATYPLKLFLDFVPEIKKKSIVGK